MTLTWSTRHGLLFGAALYATGLLCQLGLGPVEWSFFERPFNYLALLIFLIGLYLLNRVRDKAAFVRWLSDASCATASLLWCGAATVVMGLVRQSGESHWPGFHQMTSQWSFVLLWAWLLVSVVMALYRLALPFSPRKLAFYLSHVGIVVALLSATLGSADLSRYRLLVGEGREAVAGTLKVEWLDGSMERYPDGTPKSYAVKVRVQDGNEAPEEAVIQVNKPYSKRGFKLYLFNYSEPNAATVAGLPVGDGSTDRELSETAVAGASVQAVLEVVRDPWLPAVMTGIALLLAGALLRFFQRRWS